MVLTVTREEVEQLIRDKFSLPEDIKIHIKETDTHSVAPLKVSVNNENFVQDIAKEEGVPAAFMEGGTQEEGKRCRMTSSETQDAYERYAEIAEEFLKSGKKEQRIDLEDRSVSTMRYRYNTAIKMYGLDSGVCVTSMSPHDNYKGHVKLVRKR